MYIYVHEPYMSRRGCPRVATFRFNVYTCVHFNMYIYSNIYTSVYVYTSIQTNVYTGMGWLRLVGSIKL